MTDKQVIIEKIEKFSKKTRLNIIETAYKTNGKSAHIGGALSIVDILATLYGHILEINPENYKSNDRNRFILSKGHSVLGYYSCLYQIGLITKEELNNYEKPNTFLFGHPIKNREKGIEFSNGSLGMGLSLGIGVALAGKKRNQSFKTYVIIGDGECNEGSIWEAAMAAPKFKLNNLFVIIDKNNYQQTGSNDEIMPSLNLVNKWKEFGWDVIEIDGHNINEILDSIQLESNNHKPRAIVANTIKGKGFSFTENNNSWHHNILTEKMYLTAINEID